MGTHNVEDSTNRPTWTKICSSVGVGAYIYDFEKLAKLHCVQPVPRLASPTVRRWPKKHK